MAEPGSDAAAGRDEPAPRPPEPLERHGAGSTPPPVDGNGDVHGDSDGRGDGNRRGDDGSVKGDGSATGDDRQVGLPATSVDQPIELERLRASEPHWLNVPNAITFLRALLVPVILWLLVTEGDTDVRRWWAFGIFLFAAATDSIDGWVARRWHGVTRWGQLADPIADKLLIIGSLASLAHVGDLPWWAVNVIVVREIAVTLLRVQLVQRIGLVMPASNWGKAKTVSQVVAVAVYLLPAGGATLPRVLLNIAVALTVWSGIEYAFRAGRLARDAARRREEVT